MGSAKEYRSLGLCLLVMTAISNQVLMSEASNILFFIGFGGPSHRIAMQPLADTLASRGHNVTFLVHEKPKESNFGVQYYVPEKLSQHFLEFFKGSLRVDFYQIRASGGSSLRPLFLPNLAITMCDKLYSDPKTKQWLHSTKFDLVIIDGLFNECGYAIAHLHGSKTIVFSISTFLPWVAAAFGLPDETSFIPDVWFRYGGDQDHFLQRTLTAVVPIFWQQFRQWYYFPRLAKATREGLGLSGFPDYAELEKNTSLFLVNTHVAQEYPRSIPSNVVPVGGISWMETNNKIPKVSLL